MLAIVHPCVGGKIVGGGALYHDSYVLIKTCTCKYTHSYSSPSSTTSSSSFLQRCIVHFNSSLLSPLCTIATNRMECCCLLYSQWHCVIAKFLHSRIVITASFWSLLDWKIPPLSPGKTFQTTEIWLLFAVTDILPFPQKRSLMMGEIIVYHHNLRLLCTSHSQLGSGKLFLE